MITKKGFTLIELLIVVAIIAILAAIAVPNFLEAQVRSKVSRTKSDLRTFVTAIEAYAIDNRHYPTYGTDYNGLQMTPATEPQICEPHRLTTPIAYITSDSSMIDPFRTKSPPASWGAEPPYYFKLYNYVNWDDVRYKDIGYVHDRYGEWRLTGAGPDGWFFNTGSGGPDSGPGFQVVPYDATNGSVSVGDIIRTQKDTEFQKQYI